MMQVARGRWAEESCDYHTRDRDPRKPALPILTPKSWTLGNRDRVLRSNIQYGSRGLKAQFLN